MVKRACHHSSRSRATCLKDFTVTSPKTGGFFFPFVHPLSETKGIKECDTEVMTNEFSTFGKTPKGLTSPSEKAKVMLTDEARQQRKNECSAQL